MYRSLAIWDGLRLGFKLRDSYEKVKKNVYQQPLVEEKEGTCPAFHIQCQEKNASTLRITKKHEAN